MLFLEWFKQLYGNTNAPNYATCKESILYSYTTEN